MRKAKDNRKGLFKLLFTLILGIMMGVGVYTFVYAKGYSYMLDDPKACANCHVMQGQYDAWLNSSHHAFAVCNDCHVPHQFAGKYFTKATNGAKHSYFFTFGNFPEPIRISDSQKKIAADNCVRCHESVVSKTHANGHENLPCANCHKSVGHK